MANKRRRINLELDAYHGKLLDGFTDRSGLNMTAIVCIALRELSRNDAALQVILPGYKPAAAPSPASELAD